VKRRNSNKLFQTICLLVLLFGCQSKVDNNPRDIGLEYAPLEIGSWVVYQVDSHVYDDFNLSRPDTNYKYQIKELVESEFQNQVGQKTRRIERYSRNADTLPWILSNVWAANLSSNSFEKVEDNIRYVKLVFPVKENNSWNGNQFNTLEEWNYRYFNSNAPRFVNGFTFDSTLVVNQINDSNVIQRKYAYEIYAKGIGMVFKRIDTLETQNGKRKGLRYSQVIKDWSK